MLSPIQLGTVYVVAVVVLEGVAGVFPSLALLIGWLEIALLVSLFVVVAYFRDDDPLAAGVLIALITGVGALVSVLLTGVVQTRSIAPLVLGLPSAFIALVLRGAVGGVVGMAVVWVLRRLRRDRASPRSGRRS